MKPKAKAAHGKSFRRRASWQREASRIRAARRADIAVTVDLPNGADLFQVRMFYSGHGTLAVASLGITPLNPSAASP